RFGGRIRRKQRIDGEPSSARLGSATQPNITDPFHFSGPWLSGFRIIAFEGNGREDVHSLPAAVVCRSLCRISRCARGRSKRHSLSTTSRAPRPNVTYDQPH